MQQDHSNVNFSDKNWSKTGFHKFTRDNKIFNLMGKRQQHTNRKYFKNDVASDSLSRKSFHIQTPSSPKNYCKILSQLQHTWIKPLPFHLSIWFKTNEYITLGVSYLYYQLILIQSLCLTLLVSYQRSYLKNEVIWTFVFLFESVLLVLIFKTTKKELALSYPKVSWPVQISYIKHQFKHTCYHKYS